MVVVGSRDRGGREGPLCYSTAELQYRGSTVPAGTVHSVVSARVLGVVGALGTPAVGLCP